MERLFVYMPISTPKQSILAEFSASMPARMWPLRWGESGIHCEDWVTKKACIIKRTITTTWIDNDIDQLHVQLKRLIFFLVKNIRFDITRSIVLILFSFHDCYFGTTV